MKKILKFVKDCILFILFFLVQYYIFLILIYQGVGDFMIYEQEPSNTLVPGGRLVIGGQDETIRTEFTEYGKRVLWVSNIVFLFLSFLLVRWFNKFFNKLVESKRKKLNT